MNFNEVNIQITKEDILSKISEYDVFKKYCTNFKEINVSFISDLRVSDTPNCRIHLINNNELRYKDFKMGDYLDCWNYVMKKFYCTYYEALTIIANDFNIRNFNLAKSDLKNIVMANDEFRLKVSNIPKQKALITIISQPWNKIDYEYWNQYGISLELLDEYNVFSAKNVYLYKGDKRITLSYTKTNPCYAYRFEREGTYSYKVYFPLTKDKKYKWLFSGGTKDDIEGYDQLPLSGDVLILTKSLKDVMCFRVLGYNAISLQGEGNKLEQELVNKLLKRFDKIIINYDGDERGIIETNKLNKQYGFDYFYIDNHKDLSDYIKYEGLDKSKKMIYDKIRTF